MFGDIQDVITRHNVKHDLRHGGIHQHGRIGEWRTERELNEKFAQLPTKMKDFVSKPVNRPYLELAMRLSELSVEKLRTVAESLLEITY